MNLLDVGGNFLNDASSIEAWDFEQVDGSGNFPGLFVPSRVLTITGAGVTPIQRVAGHRGMGVYQPAVCDQYLETPYDDSYNALQNLYNWVAVSGWFKMVQNLGFIGLGISNGVLAEQQWHAEMIPSTYSQINNGPQIDTGLGNFTAGAWNHFVLQFHYDGSGTGVDMKARINGVDYNTISGSTAVTPVFLATTAFRLGKHVSFTSEQVVWDSLLMWKSGTAPLDSDSMDDLYNSGMGIEFVPGGGRRRKMRRLVAAARGRGGRGGRGR